MKIENEAELIQAYEKLYQRTHREDLLPDLHLFLKLKKIYRQDESNIENRLNMKMAYDKIYMTTKHIWVGHVITEQRFWELVDGLQQ